MILDINSDRSNQLRFLTTIFKNLKQVSKISINCEMLSNFESITNQYKDYTKSLLTSITSNQDYRIGVLNSEISTLINFVNSISTKFKCIKSPILLHDTQTVLIEKLKESYLSLIEIKMF